MEFNALCNSYLEHRGRYCREQTNVYNRNQVDAILKYLSIKNITDVSDITYELVEDYIHYNRFILKVKNTTNNKRIQMLKRVINYGVESELLDYAAYARILKIEKLRCHSEPFKTLTETEFDLLLEYIDSLSITNFYSFRMKLMLLVYVSTGIRMTESIYIERKNVNLEKHSIYLSRTKTEEPRTVYINEDISKLLSLYMQRFRSQYLFAKKDGQLLTIDNVTCLFKSLSKKIGFSVSPHIIRHTFATLMLKQGIDIESLRKLMGHADISTTQIYLCMSDDYVQAQHIKFNPLNRK